MQVFSFYRFTPLESIEELQPALLSAALERGLLGTILLAEEGINGTIAGSAVAIRSLMVWLATWSGLGELNGRWSGAKTPPFRRMRVKRRAEIVTLGISGLQPLTRTAAHVAAGEFNQLLDDPATLVIDTRNDYEIDVGRFPGAIDPGTRNFREFPDFVTRELLDQRDRPIAMYCTGGIRCEKASSLLLELGFTKVFQLEGGVLTYLDTVSPDENRWHGECFVFDSRVAVDRELAPGNYVQCHGCRRPLSGDDLSAATYQPGIACPHCHDSLDASRSRRLLERRRQRTLSGQDAG